MDKKRTRVEQLIAHIENDNTSVEVVFYALEQLFLNSFAVKIHRDNIEPHTIENVDVWYKFINVMGEDRHSWGGEVSYKTDKEIIYRIGSSIDLLVEKDRGLNVSVLRDSLNEKLNELTKGNKKVLAEPDLLKEVLKSLEND